MNDKLLICILVLIIIMLVLQIAALAKFRSIKNTPVNESAGKLNLQEKSEDEEIVAAIMGAICAYMGKSSENIRIKSIKRVENNMSSWRKAGLELQSKGETI